MKESLLISFGSTVFICVFIRFTFVYIKRNIMDFFNEILSITELKTAYRRLAMIYHPDLGGNDQYMQQVNKEYKYLERSFRTAPNSLREVRIGNTVYVNKSRCIVTAVEPTVFKAKSVETKREAYFSKTTGYAMLNYKLKACLVND